MAKRIPLRETLGFGFDPTTSGRHFTLALDERVTIGESHSWREGATEPGSLVEKASLSREQWRALAVPVARLFNERVRASYMLPGKWQAQTPLDARLGMELTLLFWAAEDTIAAARLHAIVTNWAGLAPEERWWLYHQIHATSGHPDYGHDRGWRQAVKIAFTENPIA